MIVRLIRHGETAYNIERRYQGRRDIPLSENGRAELFRGAAADRVYITPLQRTAQTAGILFPGAEQIVVSGLVEMDFGKFEGHTYEELKDDPDYRAFHQSGGWADCPGGERRADFSARVCAAFRELVTECESRGEERAAIVTHGGPIMALMERYGAPAGGYYEWLPGNGEGYELEITLRTDGDKASGVSSAGDDHADTASEREDLTVRTLRRISYNKKAGRIHLYHGDGRGKSSTAAGTALRAICAGFEVTYFQLCKSRGSGECVGLEKLGAKLLYGEAEGQGFVSRMDAEEKAALLRKQSEILTEIAEDYRRRKPERKRLLVLDEACAAIRQGVLEEELLKALLLRKPTDLEIIMTGRQPAQWMIDASDYVTEYRNVRHPYTEGVKAREGVEF